MFAVCRALALLLLVAGSETTVRAGSVVTGFVFSSGSSGEAVLRVRAEGAIDAFSQPRLLPDGRTEVVLFNTSLREGVPGPDPEGPIREVEVIPFGRGHLALRFTGTPDRRLAAVAYRDREATDVFIRLEAVMPPVVEPFAAADSIRGGAGPSLTAARTRWTLDTIVIDAGHGGKDAGATAHGVREKDVTLAVARKVGRMVEDKLGCRVVYTREDDRFVELRERGKIANREVAKLFVSIHVNAAPNGGGSGTETYFLGPHKSEAARSVLERENSVVEYESDPTHYEAFTQNAPVLKALTQSAYLHKSEQLAALVEEQFEASLGMRSRGVKQAGFYVLWSASMPSVLIELGFVTNPKEASYLSSGAGQNELAGAIFRAIRSFKEQYERDLNLAHSD